MAKGHFTAAACLFAVSVCIAARIPAQETAEVIIDENSGLIVDEHWQLVKAHCTACHSAQQVTQQRGSRETWLSLIRWMQKTQGLWQFDPLTENSILDYLEKNYAPAASYRRAPLAPELMPELMPPSTDKASTESDAG